MNDNKVAENHFEGPRKFPKVCSKPVSFHGNSPNRTTFKLGLLLPSLSQSPQRSANANNFDIRIIFLFEGSLCLGIFLRRTWACRIREKALRTVSSKKIIFELQRKRPHLPTSGSMP